MSAEFLQAFSHSDPHHPQIHCENVIFLAKFRFHGHTNPLVHHIDFRSPRYSIRLTIHAGGAFSLALQPNPNAHVLHRVADFELAA